MKKIYLIAVSVLLIHTAQAQFTTIPDSNFEQALIDLGYDDIIDGQVLTANIVNVTDLDLYDLQIQNMTGIEDFASLIELWVDYNQLTSLDVSQNLALQFLVIDENPISIIDISNNTNLVGFAADFTNLTALNTSNNPNLLFLFLWDCNITSLDLSNNTNLVALDVDENNLTQLDLINQPNLEVLYCEDNFNLSFINLKNGNTAGLVDFFAQGLAANACIQVDDAQAATNASTFPYNQWNIDPSSTFSEECSLSTETFDLAQITFYPNPAIDKLTILNITITGYQIYDAKGSLLANNTRLSGNQIDVASLKPGIYFLKVTSDKNQTQTVRFVKK